jgi:aminoglycoside phosphotransferase (APT) family kinase protein
VPDGKLARYRVAIQENFPALPLDSLRYMAEGWDSLVCQVNERLIFRFPKRPEVAERLALETRLLPELAPTLPLPVPQFTYISKPTGLNFPYLFVGYEALPGLTQPDWPEEVAQATWWKADLGDFLTALHAFPIERARKLGVQEKNFPGSNGSEDNWRESLEAFYSLVREQVEPLLSEGRQDQAADYFEDFLDDDRHFSFEPVLLHGDLSGDHVLLDPLTQKVKGIIDFGDVCLGDPAFDVAQSVLPYYRGKVDPTFKQRQLFYGRLALFFAITFGLEHSDPALVEYGLSIINQGGLSLPEA